MMPGSIAEFYIDELNVWKDTLDFRMRELEGLEENLSEVLRFNTVPNLAATVEHYLNQVLLMKQKLAALASEIGTFEQKLFKQDTPLMNEMVTESQKLSQKSLRENFYLLEREQLDIKYQCDTFLAETINKQGKKQNNTNHEQG